MVSVDVRIEMTMDQLILNLKDFYDVDFPDLKKYYYAKKRGTWIPRIEFDDDGYLRFLKLVSENMKHLSNDLFNNIDTRSLSNLSLKNCRIRTIDQNFKTILQKLKYLDLSKNEITAFPKSIFSPENTLERFNISYNDLSSLPCELLGLFQGSSKLRINIEGNKLKTEETAIDNYLFNNVEKMRNLFCRENYCNPKN